MRSIYTKVLVWCFATLAASLAAFVGVAVLVPARMIGNRGGPFQAVNALSLQQAVEAYEQGGPATLRSQLDHLHRFLGADYYLVDRSGVDLTTGESRSDLIARARSRPGLPRRSEPMVESSVYGDGEYRLLSVRTPPFELSSFVPYYACIVAAIAILCWALAAQIALPLKALAETVQRFGHGDLSARAGMKRGDEIGDLSRTFDQMADKIETLLTAERRLLQDVSHELRSPLARLGFAAELTRTAVDREGAAARMRKEIDRLSKLVSMLVEMARAEGDPESRRFETFSLDALLAEIVEDCRMDADSRRVAVELRVSDPAMVQGDPDLLRRAIENVLRNALRFAPCESSVEVVAEQNGSTISVAVRDYGPGVEPSILEHIFKPFFRADESRDAETGGIGIGLAIAQRSLLLHHGRIWAELAQPGLRVVAELPAA